MKAHYTERFLKNYALAPERIQTACDKQIRLLLANPRHNSLQTKKYDESRNVWQARVTKNWRFTLPLRVTPIISLN